MTRPGNGRPDQQDGPPTNIRRGTLVKRRAAALFVAAGTAVVLAVTSRWWLPALPTLFGAVEANSELIDAFAGLTDIVTSLVLLLGAGLAYLGLRGVRAADAGGEARQANEADDGALREGGDTQYFGAYIMGLDLPNIRAAHEWARAHAPEDRRALEYLSRLPAQGRRVLAERLAPGEFLDWLTLAEESARAIGDQDEARAHREAVGAALLMKGRLREALAYSEENFEAAKTRGDAVGMATALANRASIRNSMGAHDDALDLARRAEAALEDADAPDVLLGAIGQQAEALDDSGGDGSDAVGFERTGALGPAD